MVRHPLDPPTTALNVDQDWPEGDFTRRGRVHILVTPPCTDVSASGVCAFVVLAQAPHEWKSSLQVHLGGLAACMPPKTQAEGPESRLRCDNRVHSVRHRSGPRAPNVGRAVGEIDNSRALWQLLRLGRRSEGKTGAGTGAGQTTDRSAASPGDR